jgi:hypothetical protein
VERFHQKEGLCRGRHAEGVGRRCGQDIVAVMAADLQVYFASSLVTTSLFVTGQA